MKCIFHSMSDMVKQVNVELYNDLVICHILMLTWVDVTYWILQKYL